MTPETNHDVEISIYHDFLEDQGVIVYRNPEDQDQWIYEFKPYTSVGGDTVIGVVGGCDIVGGVGVGVGGVYSVVGVRVGVGGFGDFGDHYSRSVGG